MTFFNRLKKGLLTVFKILLDIKVTMVPENLNGTTNLIIKFDFDYIP